MLNFLTDELKETLRHLNKNLLYELRLREESPVVVNYAGTFRFLTPMGLSDQPHGALTVTKGQIGDILSNACEKSVYAVNEELKHAFVTTKKGVRIGVGGVFVTEGDKIVSVRDFSSLCIRVPHTVDGCADIVKKVCLKTPSSVLLLSPPGMGKTTFLKDIIRFLSTRFQVFLADERGELYESGCGADAMVFADKKKAFSYGIRALRPDFIVTDELAEEDYPALERVMKGGVKVIASAHLTSEKEVPKNIFSHYVLLSSQSIGKVERILSREGETEYA